MGPTDADEDARSNGDSPGEEARGADADVNESAGPDVGRSDDARGPPSVLPEQVPDHVAQIHETIRQFLNDTLEGPLGEAISAITPGEDAEAGDGTESDDDTEAR